MKTLALLALLTVIPAQQSVTVAPPVHAPAWVDYTLTAPTPAGDAKIYLAGDLCVVAWAGRVLGPLPWAALPSVPGQAAATAGTTVCVTDIVYDDNGDFSLFTKTVAVQHGGDGMALGQAVAHVVADLAALELAHDGVTGGPCPEGQG
jgi:hypothetical protein